jgi:hypothetical protein
MASWMALSQLVMDPGTGIGGIAAFLDGLTASQRLAQLRQLGRDQQRTLYQKASEDIDLRYLVGDAGPREEIIHDGVNTLPVAAPLRRFQKRFCRPGDPDATELFGYNEGPLRRVIGPGYFVASLPGDAAQRAHGAVMVDYYRVPDAAVAAGWPRVVHNRKGLQRFVYDQTRDFLRRVSTHVSVGAAFKRDEPLDHYFVLSRRS